MDARPLPCARTVLSRSRLTATSPHFTSSRRELVRPCLVAVVTNNTDPVIRSSNAFQIVTVIPFMDEIYLTSGRPHFSSGRVISLSIQPWRAHQSRETAPCEIFTHHVLKIRRIDVCFGQARAS